MIERIIEVGSGIFLVLLGISCIVGVTFYWILSPKQRKK